MAVILSPRLRTGTAVLLVGVSTAIAAPLVRAEQSLADVASKEEARRKTVPAPAKVYTNKDLSPAPQGSSTPPATSTAAAPTPGRGAVPDTKDPADKPGKDTAPAKDQAYWAGRLKALKDKLDRDTSFADALQIKVNSLSTDFVNRDDPAQRALIERNRQKAIAELAGLHKDIATGKKAIADLVEEARRAGVPPGWLR
jgi:hypothetical protein